MSNPAAGRMKESNSRQAAPPPSYTPYEPMVRRSREPPRTYESPLPRSQEFEKETFETATVAAVERTMKKYADNLLRVLEGLTGRLSQLESSTQRREHLYGEIMNAVVSNHGEADGKLRSLENPALRAVVESSHSSLYLPVAFRNRNSFFLSRSSVSQNLGPPIFGALSSSSFDSIHLPSVSYFRSSTCNQSSRSARFSISPAVGLTSNFHSTCKPFAYHSTCKPETSPLPSSVPRKFTRAAFLPSAMSLPDEPSLQSLSLQDPDPQAQAALTQANDSKDGDEAVKEEVLVQYIVIRKDLVSEQSWPLGSIISQGCHAAVAAIWLYKDDPDTAHYCRPENLDHMHKVTLEVKGEIQLRNLAQKLETAGVVHKLWIEQPENYATCLATKPYYKSQVASHFKKLKLCK